MLARAIVIDTERWECMRDNQGICSREEMKKSLLFFYTDFELDSILEGILPWILRQSFFRISFSLNRLNLNGKQIKIQAYAGKNLFRRDI